MRPTLVVAFNHLVAFFRCDVGLFVFKQDYLAGEREKGHVGFSDETGFGCVVDG